MTRSVSKRSAFLAYAASLTVIAGLMTVVALGGSSITAKRSAVDFSAASVSAR